MSTEQQFTEPNFAEAFFSEAHYDAYCQARSALFLLGKSARWVRHGLAYADVLAAVDALHPDITHIDSLPGDRAAWYAAAREGIAALPQHGIDPAAAQAAVAALDAAWQAESEEVTGHDLRPENR